MSVAKFQENFTFRSCWWNLNNFVSAATSHEKNFSRILGVDPVVLELLLKKISFTNRSNHNNTAVNLLVGPWRITGEEGDAQWPPYVSAYFLMYCPIWFQPQRSHMFLICVCQWTPQGWDPSLLVLAPLFAKTKTQSRQVVVLRPICSCLLFDSFHLCGGQEANVPCFCRRL